LAHAENADVVLTGYNTDIEFAGTTYHVQTEDKGRSNPYVESLVYAKGEILYSRRTPYRDLLEQEVDQKAIATLMERQHRTIAEAIRRGRLAELTTRVEEAGSDDDTTVTHTPSREEVITEAEPSLDQVILDYLEAQRGRAHLVLRASGDHDFVYGHASQVRIVAVDSHGNAPQAEVRVAVLFKSTAEPRRLVLAEGETDAQGIFEASAQLPPFNGGTSAVVITAESDLGQSEIKHLVHR
jgi:hypothetical protein